MLGCASAFTTIVCSKIIGESGLKLILIGAPIHILGKKVERVPLLERGIPVVSIKKTLSQVLRGYIMLLWYEVALSHLRWDVWRDDRNLRCPELTRRIYW